MTGKKEYTIATDGAPRMGRRNNWVRLAPVCATYEEAEKLLERFPTKGGKLIVARFKGEPWEEA